MKMKCIICFSLITILSSLMFFGCAEKKEDIILVEQDTILYPDIAELNDEQLETVLTEQPSIYQLKEKLEDVSFKALGKTYYTVLKTRNQTIWVTFDSDGNYAGFKKIEFSNPASQKALGEIKLGDKLESVMRADDLGDFNFLYASQTNFPQISYHFFADGRCYEICYKGGIVTGIYTFTI